MNAIAADQKMVEQIQSELKRIGDNGKDLRDSLQKDLAEVRKLAETGKTDLDQEIIALKESVVAKQEAMEAAHKGFGDRLDDLDTMIQRRLKGSSGLADGADEVKRAVQFDLIRMSNAGELKLRNAPTAEKVDLDKYRGYCKQYPMYLRRDDRGLELDEVKLLQEGSDPAGGYWVPPAMDSRIRSKVFETSPVRQVADVITIGTDAYEAPYDDGEFGAGWVGEAEARPDTANSEVGQLRIPVHEIYAQPKATQRLLDDASIDVEGWMSSKVADKFTRVENTAFVVGNGVKKPRGILTYAAGTSRGQIEQVVTGHATLITADSIKGMPYNLLEPYHNGASWMMNRLTVQAIMLLKDADNQYLWRPGLTEGQPASLVGYPVRMATDVPVVGSGALAVVFGNFRVGYLIVDRLGISVLRDPYTDKPNIRFYTRKRVGGDVVQHEAIKILKVST